MPETETETAYLYLYLARIGRRWRRPAVRGVRKSRYREATRTLQSDNLETINTTPTHIGPRPRQRCTLHAAPSREASWLFSGSLAYSKTEGLTLHCFFAANSTRCENSPSSFSSFYPFHALFSESGGSGEREKRGKTQRAHPTLNPIRHQTAPVHTRPHSQISKQVKNKKCLIFWIRNLHPVFGE